MWGIFQIFALLFGICVVVLLFKEMRIPYREDKLMTARYSHDRVFK